MLSAVWGLGLRRSGSSLGFGGKVWKHPQEQASKQITSRGSGFKFGSAWGLYKFAGSGFRCLGLRFSVWALRL